MGREDHAEIDAYIETFNHYTRYLRRSHPTLTEEELTREVSNTLKNPAIREFFQRQDRLDETIRRKFPNVEWKPWYERT